MGEHVKEAEEDVDEQDRLVEEEHGCLLSRGGPPILALDCGRMGLRRTSLTAEGDYRTNGDDTVDKVVSVDR